MRLSLEQARTLADALIVSFETRASLQTMLRSRLGRGLDGFTPDATLEDAVWNMISYFQQRNESERLVAAARDSRPSVDEFRWLADAVFRTPVEDWTLLERRLSAEIPDLDPTIWREKEAAIEAAVCAIRFPLSDHNESSGTGCLIGRDLVLTAAHVMRPVIDRLQRQAGVTADPDSVTFRFDFKKVREGPGAADGVTYRLARNWLAVVDDDLDFAAVRLDTPVALEPVGSRTASEADAPKRGCITVPEGQVAYTPASPLLILHHPRGEEMKLAIATQSIVGLEKNGTRLLHKTNTEGGSSGAPCFDIHWKLIGIHRGTIGGQPHNEAVPIVPIAAALRAGGLLDAKP